MKAINNIFMGLGLLAAGSLMGACTGDLDIPVQDPNQISPDGFGEDPTAYLDRCASEMYQGLTTASCWGPGSTVIGFGDAGAGTFSRTVFNIEEMSTDNYSWLQFTDAGYYELVTMNLAADNEIMYINYARLYAVIAMCNQFIRTVNDGSFGDDPAIVSRAAEYVRQAKVVRGLAYYYALSAYGNIGYIDETAASGSTPVQFTREEAFNTLVATLEEVSAEWGDSYVEPPYGYIGKEACDALLTRYYLNAATWTSTPMYDKCWTLCQKIIANHKGEGLNGSGLAESYKALFGANNYEYATQGSRANEIIWTLPQNGMNLQSYGNSTFYIATVCGSYDGISSVGDCNLNAQWTCMVARQQLSERMGFDAEGYPTDLRAELWKTSKDGFKIDNSTIMGNAGYGQGYAPIKYTNFAYDEFGNIDEAASPASSNTFADADWAEIRLAEIYLNAAESNIIGNAGTQAEALAYINCLRERAGVDAWGVSQMTASNILDERDRELYGENDRRTSLVRHGKYAGSLYLWNWKGGVQQGQATPEHMNLFPIPSKVIAFSKYKQNQGYN